VAGNIIIIEGAKRQLRQFTMAMPLALANGIIEAKSITRTVHLNEVARFVANVSRGAM
jgi:hypothetical protein